MGEFVLAGEQVAPTGLIFLHFDFGYRQVASPGPKNLQLNRGLIRKQRITT